MIPSYQECMLPLLKMLEKNGTLTYDEATKKISDWFNLSPEEKVELLPSGKQTIIKNRIGWAKFYLNKAGLVKVLARRKYAISDKGKALLQRGIESLTTDDLMDFAEFRDFIINSRSRSSGQHTSSSSTQPSITSSQSSTSSSTSPRTPEEIMEENYKHILSNLIDDVIEKVLQQNPYFFERLVLDLLMKMGYGEGKVTSRTNDGGIDGIIDEDKLGFDKVHIQAKRWNPGHNVGRRELQGFVGALAGQSGSKGVFITTSDFTQEAIDYNPSNVKIVKINGKKLAEFMIQYNVGVTNKATFEIKKIDLDYFEEE